jgi:hypothetical protein
MLIFFPLLEFFFIKIILMKVNCRILLKKVIFFLGIPDLCIRIFWVIISIIEITLPILSGNMDNAFIIYKIFLSLTDLNDLIFICKVHRIFLPIC